ncbi:hypothetical protein GQ53DRAFT_839022 [Thozetella sp. PMI_491]|nr:hypothetical protein GQ53DRAFT_839022 [Thozetella sp. PMI_491]
MEHQQLPGTSDATVADRAPISETVRERETFKYDDLAISTAGRDGPQPAKAIKSSTISTTPDPGLTAFAQLGLHVLKASRALISLFDRSDQHIIAEAIRLPSLGPDGDILAGQPEPVWFNGLTFERATSICEHVVTGAATEQTIPGSEHGLGRDDVPVSVVNHLDNDPRYCQIQDPGRQFYAGVPIRSPAGINIGVYCVFDDKPRPQGLNASEVRFIRDMSKVVMDYLESKRSHELYRREQRMIRGLGRFVEGGATLWTGSEGRSNRAASLQELPGMKEGTLNKKLQSGSSELQQIQEPRPKLEAPAVNSHGSANGAGAIDSERDGGTTSTSRPSSKMATEATQKPQQTPPKSHASPADLLRNDVERVFAKAANVVREAIEVEGVLFLDSSIRSYGGLVGSITSEFPGVTESNSSDESMPSRADLAAASDTTCGVLGFATSRYSSVSGDAPPNEFTGCKERFIQRLLQRYPQGRIFNFEADGAVSDHTSSSGADDAPPGRRVTPPPPGTPNSSSSRPQTPKPPKKRKTVASRIIKMFPGARSVAIVPLWDPQTGRPFAAGLAWTLMPTRILTKESEVSYLRVFALATMAEVARLKTRMADKAKSDILGSISHELRSPLHGVVGAVELLRNTLLDVLQESILWTIETSARTLTDTIDHLLDFVKINNIRSSRLKHKGILAHKRHSSNPPSASNALELPVPVQLDLLVEEVVDSVLTGYSYLAISETGSPAPEVTSPSRPTVTSRPAAHAHSRSGIPKPTGAVQIYLDIDHRADWAFHTHPGAFRRIVMNLFGNSFKFTRSGFIRVALRQEGQTKRSGGASPTSVVLSVSDSGKGIGEEYLRNSLFTPFSQEDRFAPGTGLGLSLVRRIAATLGGTVDVSSKAGQGTTIVVALPLPHAPEELSTEVRENFGQMVAPLSKQRVQLVGFEREPRVREAFRADDSTSKSQLELMEGVCQDALGMIVLTDPSSEFPPPDFVISIFEDEVDGAETQKNAAKCPHVFIHQDLFSVHGISSQKQRLSLSHTTHETLGQPVGPRKLARALLASQLRYQRGQTSMPALMIDGRDLNETTAPSKDGDVTNTDIGIVKSKLQAVEEGQVSLAPEITQPSATLADPPPRPVRPSAVRQMSADLLAARGGAINMGHRTWILIVDDNAINLKILGAYMSKLKYSYTTAVNGLEALDIYTSTPNKYSCVLTDISMPIMDGLESTRRIREFERAGKHQPSVVITLTGLDGADVQQDAFASGVDLFLTRPLTLQGLEEALVATGLRPKA